MAQHRPERTCIATRKAGPASDLMRFVRGPDGAVVPDLRGRLPGRGAWISPTAAALDLAIRRKLFARAFKGEAPVPPTLVADVDAALVRDLAGSLGLANKAGAVVAGFAKVEAALASREAVALIHATEARDDGRRKLAAAARRAAAAHRAAREALQGGPGEPIWAVPTFDDLPGGDLDMALGRVGVIHAALLAGEGSVGCLARWRRLRLFRGLDDGVALPRDDEDQTERPAGPETGRTNAA